MHYCQRLGHLNLLRRHRYLSNNFDYPCFLTLNQIKILHAVSRWQNGYSVIGGHNQSETMQEMATYLINYCRVLLIDTIISLAVFSSLTAPYKYN